MISKIMPITVPVLINWITEGIIDGVLGIPSWKKDVRCFITGCAKKKPTRKPPAPLTKLHQSIMVLLPILLRYKTLFIYKALEEREGKEGIEKNR